VFEAIASARKANEAKAVFLANVSHGLFIFSSSFSYSSFYDGIEMRTPLMTIIGWSNMILTEQHVKDLLDRIKVTDASFSTVALFVDNRSHSNPNPNSYSSLIIILSQR
jgi:hypothetical protein